jgi:hypothetical protein
VNGELLVETGGGATLAGGRLRLPPHVGAVAALSPES